MLNGDRKAFHRVNYECTACAPGKMSFINIVSTEKVSISRPPALHSADWLTDCRGCFHRRGAVLALIEIGFKQQLWNADGKGTDREGMAVGNI